MKMQTITCAELGAQSEAQRRAKEAIVPWAEDSARVWAQQALSVAMSFDLELSICDGVITFRPAQEESA